MKRTRETYIPAEAELHFQDQLSSAVIYRYERNGQLIGIAFRGQSQKPSWHYRFQSAQEQEQHEQDFIKSVRAGEQAKKEYRQKKNAPHTLKPGDILFTSWGWEQTNIDFFRVVAVKSKTITLQEIGATSVTATGWASDMVIASPENIIGTPFLKRADGFNRVKLDRSRTAQPYDGRPLHRSWYA